MLRVFERTLGMRVFMHEMGAVSRDGAIGAPIAKRIAMLFRASAHVTQGSPAKPGSALGYPLVRP